MISSKIYINLRTTQQLDDNNFSINIIIKQRFFLSFKNILQYLLIFFSLRRFSYSFAFLTFASPCPSSPPLPSSPLVTVSYPSIRWISCDVSFRGQVIRGHYTNRWFGHRKTINSAGQYRFHPCNTLVVITDTRVSRNLYGRVSTNGLFYTGCHQTRIKLRGSDSSMQRNKENQKILFSKLFLGYLTESKVCVFFFTHLIHLMARK